MRVSNDTLRSAFLAALDDARRRIMDTQQQVSTGLRINSPADDPVAAARVAHLDASLTRLDQYQANAVFARNQLGLEEESLNEAIGNLQSIRELTLQANNGTASAGDRQVIAAEIDSTAMRCWRSRTRPTSTAAICSAAIASRDRSVHDRCERQRRLQRRSGTTHAADQRQPLRRDQRFRRRRVPAHRGGQWHVRA